MAKNAFYFSHDGNAHSDPKILALVQEKGMEGYGCYWRLVEMLFNQSGYKLPKSKFMIHSIAQAWSMGAEEAEGLLRFMVEDLELFCEDEQSIWSESLLRRMGIREEIQQRKRERAVKAAESRWKKPEDDADAMQEHSNSNASAMQDDAKGKERKEKERKEKERKEKGKDELKLAEVAGVVVDYLNAKVGTGFRSSSAATRRLIQARLNEGFEEADFRKVIDNKVAEWYNNDKMKIYLRPETLFGAKFEAYLNQGAKAVDAYQEEQSRIWRKQGEELWDSLGAYDYGQDGEKETED